MTLPVNTVLKDGQYFDPDGRALGYLADGLPGFVTLLTSGQVIAAVPGYKIRVCGVAISCLLATACKFQSASTDISFVMSMASNGGYVLPQASAGWFETAVGEALNLNMTVNTTVGVQVIYALVR